MRKNLFIIILVLLAFTNLSGCISEDSDTTTMELMVNYEQTNGTIIESYEDGELTSKDTITLDFDFSNTKSPNKIITYGIDINSASEPVTVDASSKSTVSIEFLEHGLYHLDAYAVDENGIIENTSIIVRIDLRIEWAEYNTKNTPYRPYSK
jgi:hypothetical protein